MASIGSMLPHSTAATTTTSTSSSNGTSTDGTNSLASQQTFLQLLVAQLKNQDPTQPVQGTEFVTQLATFSNVQQSLAVRQDVDAISNKFLGSVPSGGTVTTTGTTNATTGTTGTSGTTGATTTGG